MFFKTLKRIAVALEQNNILQERILQEVTDLKLYTVANYKMLKEDFESTHTIPYSEASESNPQKD
jgi:hypothetical protein